MKFPWLFVSVSYQQCIWNVEERLAHNQHLCLTNNTRADLEVTPEKRKQNRVNKKKSS